MMRLGQQSPVLIGTIAAAVIVFWGVVSRHNNFVDENLDNRVQLRPTHSIGSEVKATAEPRRKQQPQPKSSSKGDCDAWQCDCQYLSDEYGVWHYREFGQTTEVQRDWWLKNKCRTTPVQDSKGWKIFKSIKVEQIGQMVGELQARVKRLSESEPDSDRLKKNIEFLAAVKNDQDCFSEPNWPSEKVCGGSSDISGGMARFVKFQLGHAGPLKGFDDERHPFLGGDAK